MSEINIRAAVVEDCESILHFIRELAVYEKAEHEVLATVETIRSSMFGDNSGVYGLICEYSGKPIGFSVYFFNYSTWLAKPGLYLEDLYVSSEFRGKGAGTALLKRLARIAVDKGCGRMDWVCLDWNKPSRDFYASLGAKSQDEWVGYRLDGASLVNFAEGQSVANA